MLTRTVRFMKRVLVGLRRRLRSARGIDVVSSSEPASSLSDLEYWQWRASRYGERSVVNLAHSLDEIGAVKERQISILMPLFSQCLKGWERRAIDFGCGPGRFTPEIAKRVGRCIGVDPIASLLELAPKGPGVEYRQMDVARIPLGDGSADVVWCCLVLGGLQGQVLTDSIIEIQRVLAADGLLFLVENTAITPNAEHWRFRSSEEYRRLFHSVDLAVVEHYQDAGEPISIMAGRKNLADGGGRGEP